MSEAYATREATVQTLLGLGFQPVPEENGAYARFFDSPKRDGFNMPVIQAHPYQCNNGYWCVSLEGGFKAPCVWNGPRAEWDKSDTTAEFVTFLDTNHPGWR